MSLYAAPLEKAYLPQVDLRGAALAGANLSGADLRRADLTRANLWQANLRDTFLDGADLTRADLRGASFLVAHLDGADLRGADLRGADLRGARLDGATLDSAHNLTQEQLNEAHGDNETVLPEGLTRPAHWAKAEAEGPPAVQPDNAGRAPAAGGIPQTDKFPPAERPVLLGADKSNHTTPRVCLCNTSPALPPAFHNQRCRISFLIAPI